MLLLLYSQRKTTFTAAEPPCKLSLRDPTSPQQQQLTAGPVNLDDCALDADITYRLLLPCSWTENQNVVPTKVIHHMAGLRRAHMAKAVGARGRHGYRSSPQKLCCARVRRASHTDETCTRRDR